MKLDLSKISKERDEIYIEELQDAYYSLDEWQKILKKLIKKYGSDAMLKTDAGPNNVSFYVRKVVKGN